MNATSFRRLALFSCLCVGLQVQAAGASAERELTSAHSSFAVRLEKMDWEGLRPLLSGMNLPADLAQPAQEAFITERRRLSDAGIKLISEKVSSIEIRQRPGGHVALISVVSRYTHPLSPTGVMTDARVRVAESTNGRTWRFSPLGCPLELQLQALSR